MAEFVGFQTMVIQDPYNMTFDTVPKRIYNSHYGNGVPAMITSKLKGKHFQRRNQIAVMGL